MNVFKYRYCKARMTAFVNGELGLPARRRVARFIDEYPNCERIYRRERALQQELAAALPTLGRPDDNQLDRMWAVITGELNRPDQRPRRPSLRIRYGLATLMLVLVMVLPLTMAGDNRSQMTVTQPTPDIHETVVSNIATDAGVPVAVATQIVNLTPDSGTGILPVAAPERTPDTTP